MNVYEGLNPEQEIAVRHDEGPLLVVAGAGTGKTQVITRRIARLVEEGKAKPSQILALTFTDKAAREMSDRLGEWIGWEALQVPVLTFHAFGTELLRNYGTHINRSIRGGLLNEMQKTLLIQQHIDRIKLSYYGGSGGLYEFLEGVTKYIGNLQNESVTVGDYEEYVAKIVREPGELHGQDIAEQKDLLALFKLYEELKIETGSYDFADQLLLPLEILKTKPNLVERLRRQYKYILVDEYQDTNAVQDELLRMLVPADGNLFAVGDDDQAIYGFRGAKIDNIMTFVDHFKVENPLALTENYRSGQEILDAAYSLIQNNNPDRLEAKLGLDKKLHAQKKGSVADFLAYSLVRDEYEGTIDAIAAKLNQGIAPGSMAILSATHAPLRQIAKGLRQRNIPYALSTQTNIFEHTELLQLWYLLDWIGERNRPDAISHLVLGPYINGTSDDLRRLNKLVRDTNVSFEEALRDDTEPSSLELVVKLDTWRKWARELPISQLAYKLVFETAVSERLIKQGKESTRVLRVFEDLERLLQHMQDYESVALDPTLAGYQSFFPKPPVIEVQEPLGDAEGIQLLTVHASKGLEFTVVFLVGMTQRSWSEARGGNTGLKIPNELCSLGELPEIHELRRLMYVAITRAKDELHVSAAAQTLSGSRQQVSGFISEAGIRIPDRVSSQKVDKTDFMLQKLQRFYPLKQEEAATLPFETSDGWLELSVTSLSGYEYCPYDFYLQHVLGIHHPFGPQLTFGTTLHALFETYYRAKLADEDIHEDDLQEKLDLLWSGQGYESNHAEEQARSMAFDTVKRFYEREQHSNRKVVGSEIPIRLEIPEAKLRLRGKIDAYFETDEGIEIRDFKTGRKTDADKVAAEAKTHFQLRTYALAMEALSGKLPAKVTLDYVVTGVEGSAELSRRVIDNHRDKLIKLAEAIRAGDFAPKPSAFHTCAAITYYGSEGDEE